MPISCQNSKVELTLKCARKPSLDRRTEPAPFGKNETLRLWSHPIHLPRISVILYNEIIYCACTTASRHPHTCPQSQSHSSVASHVRIINQLTLLEKLTKVNWQILEYQAKNTSYSDCNCLLSFLFCKILKVFQDELYCSYPRGSWQFHQLRTGISFLTYERFCSCHQCYL